MSAAIVQRLDLDVERAEMPVAVLVLDARVGELDVAVVIWKLVLDGPTMDALSEANTIFNEAMRGNLAQVDWILEARQLARERR